MDFKDLSIYPVKNGNPVVINVDEYITGSGVIMNPNGYIFTNSHVASYQTIKLQKAQEYGTEIIMRKALFLSDSERDKLLEDNEKLAVFGEKMLDFILKESKFEITKTISVLDPASSAEKIEDAVGKGFPAKVISITDDFYKDNKDAAIIKIDQGDLPSVKIGDSRKINVGEKIFVFGFPAAATFKSGDFFESTFTQGVVGAIKDSENSDFKIFQTDAKISEGSSGGPLINQKGEMVGLIAYQTSDDFKTTGDNFAFAIPISDVLMITNSNYISEEDKIEPDPGSFNEHFLKGIEYLQSKNCQKSIEEFSYLKSVNERFFRKEKIQNYVDQCNKIISAKQSIDNDRDVFLNKLKEIHYSVWILLIIGIFVFLGLLTIIISLTKKIKKEEKEINFLEGHVAKDEVKLESLRRKIDVDFMNVYNDMVTNAEGLDQMEEMKKESSPQGLDYMKKMKRGTFFSDKLENNDEKSKITLDK